MVEGNNDYVGMCTVQGVTLNKESIKNMNKIRKGRRGGRTQHHTTPNFTTPHQTHQITPYRTESHRTTSHHTTPHHTTPHHTILRPRQTDAWIDGWMDACMDAWVDG